MILILGLPEGGLFRLRRKDPSPHKGVQDDRLNKVGTAYLVGTDVPGGPPRCQFAIANGFRAVTPFREPGCGRQPLFNPYRRCTECGNERPGNAYAFSFIIKILKGFCGVWGAFCKKHPNVSAPLSHAKRPLFLN